MEEGEMKKEIEDEAMEEEREIRERDHEGCWVHWKFQIQLKQDCCIENPKWWKEVKEEMNGGESEKKGEEGLEICETGENIFP